MTATPDDLAQIVLDAMDGRTEIDALSKTKALDLGAAYAVQDALKAKRLARGERIIGAKVGLTSVAKQKQMGVDTPIFGFLTDTMLLAPDEPVVVDELIHPRCEPELVFGFARDLAGPGVGPADVLAATAWVAGGIEVIDSRYIKFSFTLPDVIADNTSAARFVIGARQRPPGELDLPLLGCLFEADGELLDTAAGAALMGDPAASVAALANHLGARGERIEAGWIVLAGGLTAATPLTAGREIKATYAGLGEVPLSATETAS